MRIKHSSNHRHIKQLTMGPKVNSSVQTYRMSLAPDADNSLHLMTKSVMVIGLQKHP